jgi:hypothetical protein
MGQPAMAAMARPALLANDEFMVVGRAEMYRHDEEE